MKIRILNTLIAFFLLRGLYAQVDPGFVRVDGTQLRDGDGRMIILRGINYVNKDSKNKHLNLIGDKAFKDIKAWGYNSVRMGVNWHALEPSPGVYNQIYLADLDERIAYAKEYGIYVILDMHQDLWGEKFGGGAPLWATFDNDLPHVTGGIWSDAYFISPAVQVSFDNFWNNHPVPGNMGVQDHFVASWAMLAERYKDEKHVIGFDFFNEPFSGTMVEQALGGMFTVITEFLNTKGEKQYQIEEVAAMWMDDKGKDFILSSITDEEVFVNVLNSMQPVYEVFEKEMLMPFYEKLAKAVRAVNKNHILFWEPSISTNNGIPTAISPIPEAGIQQAYFPHYYDVVLDTDLAGEADSGRLSYMMMQLVNSRQSMNLPTMIGEWGAFYTWGDQVLDAARTMTELIDDNLLGDFYWSYSPGLKEQSFFQEVLNRPYMMAATGEIISQKVGKNSFEVTWRDNKEVKSSNLIYIPYKSNLKLKRKYRSKLITLGEDGSAVLEIAPKKRNKIRKLKFSW